MENKDSSGPQGQDIGDSPRLRRSSARKVIQPTEDILRELSSRKEDEASPEPQTETKPPEISPPIPTPQVDTADAAKQAQLASAAPIDEVTPQIHAVPYPEPNHTEDPVVASPPVPPQAPTPTPTPTPTPPDDGAAAFSFKDVSLLSLLGVACASALFFTILTWLQGKLVGQVMISGNLNRFFAFYPDFLNVGSLLVIALTLGLATVLIKKRYYSIGWTRASSLAVPGMALVGAIYVNWFAFAILILFSSQDAALRWLDKYTTPLTFVVSAVLLSAIFILTLFVLRLTEKKRSLGLICCVLLTLLMIGVVYLVRDIAKNNAFNDTSKSVGGTSQVTVTLNTKNSPPVGSEEGLKRLNFNVYVPSYLPSGYKLYDSENFPGAIGPTFFIASASNKAPSYFNFTFLNKGFADSFGNKYYSHIKVNSYQSSAQYQPPQDCGIDINGVQAGACQLLSSSSVGCKVYYVISTSEDSTTEYFCKLGGVIVNVTSDEGKPSKTLSNGQSESTEIIKVYNSLKLVSKKQLSSKYSAGAALYGPSQ